MNMRIEENLIHVLARTPELFESVLDSLTDVMVYVKDTSGCYVWGNRVLVERGGLDCRAALAGKNADDLFPSLGTSTLEQDLEILRSGRPAREVLRCYRTRTGDRVWCVS